MRRGKEFAAILEAAFKPGVVRGGCGAPPCPEQLSLGEANVIDEYCQRQGFNGRDRASPARAAAGTRRWQTKALVDLWRVSNNSSKTTQEAKGIPFAGHGDHREEKVEDGTLGGFERGGFAPVSRRYARWLR